MRLVLAIIPPTRFRAVQDALAKIGVERMTVCDAQGYGPQRGAFRGGEQAEVNLLRQVVLEIAVNEDFLQRTVETLAHVARASDGSTGDGKIFVLPVEEVVRLSDTVRGEEAVS